MGKAGCMVRFPDPLSSQFHISYYSIHTFIIAAKYFGKFVDKVLLKRIRQDSIREITLKVIKVIIIIIGFVIALGLLNLSTVLTSILAGAGVVGLAIGLALQGTLNNTF